MEPTFIERPDFERDPEYLLGDTEVEPGPLSFLVNEAPADEFDPQHADAVTGLLYLGELTHSFEHYGHHFIIRTLRAGERLAALNLIKEYEDSLGLQLALQTVMVAACIEEVDRRQLYAPLEREERPEARLRRNLETVERWYEPMIAAIYEEQARLIMRQQAAFQELEGKSPAGRHSL